ncbi:MAG: diacylglycerol kinase family protein [Ruminococcus sp.]|nr:diacylglycerol kinase family protein [Ruminococcus sp.]
MCREVNRFVVAIEGICHAIRTESHLRFHLVACFYVVFFGFLYSLTRALWCITLLTASSVIGFEFINTAVESLCDFVQPSFHPLIKITKDISSGCVLVSAVFAFANGIIIFGNRDKFLFILKFYLSYPSAILSLVVTIIVSLIFIFFTKSE